MQEIWQEEQEEGDLNFLWLGKFPYLTRRQVEDCSIRASLVSTSSWLSLGGAGPRVGTMRCLLLVQN